MPGAPTVTVLLKLILSVLTSKPGGGVTKMPAVMLVPATVKLIDADSVPYVVVRADKVPVDVMIGSDVRFTAIFTTVLLLPLGGTGVFIV